MIDSGPKYHRQISEYPLSILVRQTTKVPGRIVQHTKRVYLWYLHGIRRQSNELETNVEDIVPAIVLYSSSEIVMKITSVDCCCIDGQVEFQLRGYGIGAV